MTAIGNGAVNGGGFFNVSVVRSFDMPLSNVTIGPNAWIEGNSANGSAAIGGAIQLADGILSTGENFTAINNVATGKGGALYSSSLGRSVVSLGTGAVLSSNRAGEGGAIYVFSCIVYLGDDLSVVNNTATGDGGGLYFEAIGNNFSMGCVIRLCILVLVLLLISIV
jgi:predicted outer membrane repeat protein